MTKVSNPGSIIDELMKLKHANAIFTQALEAANIGFWEWDVEKDTLYWSPVMKKIHGVDDEFEPTYKAYVDDFLHPDDRKAKIAAMENAISTGKQYEIDHRIIWPDGSIHWAQGRGRAIHEDKKLIRMIGVSLNIDEKKHAEKKLNDTVDKLLLSEEKYQAFVKNSHEGIWRIETRKPIDTTQSIEQQIKDIYEFGYMAELNGAMAKMYGFDDPQPLVGMRVKDLLVEEDPQNKEYLQKFLESGYALENFVSHEKDAKGAVKIFRNSLVGTVEDGKLVRAWGTQVDITDQQTYQDELNQSEKRFRHLIERSADAISMISTDAKFIYLSPSVKDILGFTTEELIGTTALSYLHPDEIQNLSAVLADLISGKTDTVTLQHRYRHKDGRYIWLETTATNHISDPSVKAIVTNFRDITDRKISEDNLMYQTDLLTTITDNTTFGILMMDENQICTYMNEAAEKITGFTLEEVSAGPLHNFIHHTTVHGKAYPLSKCPIDRALPEWKRKSGEEFFVHKDGSFYPVRFVASPISKYGQTVGTVLEIEDISEERKHQEELIRSKERFENLANSMPQAIWTTDKDGIPDYYNRRWYEYTGMKPEGTDFDWSEVLHPDDRERAVKSWQRAVKTGKPYQIEYRFKNPKREGAYKWFLSKAVPAYDSEGTIVRWYGSSTDIDTVKRTIKRKNELENLTANLTEERKELLALNAAKDEFISLVSHQLRTPATGVKQYIGMLLQGYFGDISEEHKEILERAYQSNERQLRTVNDMLLVARVDANKIKLAKERFDIVAMAKDAIDEQKAEFKLKKQTLQLKAPAKLTVKADSQYLRMVIDNLIENARKYTFEKGKVIVCIEQDSDHALISVKDNGVGVSEDDLSKLFQKFSRVDNPLSMAAEGSGLGLYWSKKIIDMHDGELSVKSALNKGSTFTIRLPLSQKTHEKP